MANAVRRERSGAGKVVPCDSSPVRVAKALLAVALAEFGMTAGATTLVYYPMDNMAKTSYAAGSTISDASPTGAHPGVLAEYIHGTHQYFAPRVESPEGLPGNAIRDGATGMTLRNNAVLTFTQPNDGTDGNGAEVRIEESADDRTLHLQTFTIEFMWKCAVSDRRWASPLSRSRVDPDNPPVVTTGEEATTLTLYVSNAGGRPINCITAVAGTDGTVVKTSPLCSGSDIVDGNWHHIALTLDGSTHVLKIYVDGTERGSVTLDGDLVYLDANAWVFGGHSYFGWQAGGSMDEIRISDRVLEPSEFLQFASQPDVLARYSMDATLGTQFAIGDTIPNRVNQEAAPLTVCNIVHPAYVDKYPAGDVVFYPPAAVAFEEPFNAVQEGLAGAIEANESAMAFTQPTSTAKDAYGATLQIQDDGDDPAYHLQEFTIEYFWKGKVEQHWAVPLSRTRVDASGQPLGTTGDLGQDAATLTFYLDTHNNLNCIYTAQGTQGVVTETRMVCSGIDGLFNDNRWHHHAVTFAAYTHRLVYYVDGRAVGSLTLPGPLVYEKGNAWSFGGYGYFGWQAGGTMDEIRISPYVRTPETFLRMAFSVPDKGALVHLPLDGDFKSIVNAELNPDDATLEAVVSPLLQAGNLAFDADRPGGRISNGSDDQISRRNAKSLVVSNLESGLLFPADTYRLDRGNGLTCEFFMKATREEIKEGAWAVLLAWRTSDGQRYPICFQENGSGLLNLRADSDQGVYAVIPSRTSPFDGGWHHVACTLQLTSDARSIVSCFYLDGELQGSSTTPGVLPIMSGARLEIGTRAGSLHIDEIRFSNGVLAPEDFLKPCPPTGLAIMVR